MTLRLWLCGCLAALAAACGSGDRLSSDVPREFAVTGAKTVLEVDGDNGCELGAERMLERDGREFRVSKYMLITYDDALVAADRRFPDECPPGAVGRVNRDVIVFRGFDTPSLGDYQKAELECRRQGAGGKACSRLGDMRQAALALRDEYETRRLGSSTP